MRTGLRCAGGGQATVTAGARRDGQTWFPPLASDRRAVQVGRCPTGRVPFVAGGVSGPRSRTGREYPMANVKKEDPAPEAETPKASETISAPRSPSAPRCCADRPPGGSTMPGLRRAGVLPPWRRWRRWEVPARTWTARTRAVFAWQEDELCRLAGRCAMNRRAARAGLCPAPERPADTLPPLMHGPVLAPTRSPAGAVPASSTVRLPIRWAGHGGPPMQRVCAPCSPALEPWPFRAAIMWCGSTNRQGLNGVLHSVFGFDADEEDVQLGAVTILCRSGMRSWRTIDKFDKVGASGVRELLTKRSTHCIGAFIRWRRPFSE